MAGIWYLIFAAISTRCVRTSGWFLLVAPRLTENRVPGGGRPEPSRSNSRNRGYLYSGYPSIMLYGGPKTGGYVGLHYSGCASRLSPLAAADYRPRIEYTPINTCLAYHAAAP